jgi:sulfite exporter TauE/SafE
MRELKALFKVDKSLVIGFMANYVSIMVQISCYQYGLVYYHELYEADDDSQKFITKKTSNILLIISLGSLPVMIVTGILLDKFKNWKFILGTSLIVMICLFGFWDSTK